eukprot:TRINITY_DN68681_c0_g1_i1.p1 TRINITY_DN68681_c0_g1~~TRINITY_DN68681_c0_g1_i1.p1  ORF type:complete len:701 (-),score=118.41 TRINITY_DN68681_c0_g1_i1:862-2964(-)
MQTAALKIQAVQRGRAARKELKEQKAAAQPPQQAQDEELPDLNDPEMQAAALKIQAVQRGRAARKEIKDQKAATQPPQEEDDLPDLNDPEMQAAALKIQAVQRGRVTRKELETKAKEKQPEPQEEELPDLNDPEMQAAALKIQAVQRGRAARKQVQGQATTAERREEATTQPKRAITPLQRNSFRVDTPPRTKAAEIDTSTVATMMIDQYLKLRENVSIEEEAARGRLTLKEWQAKMVIADKKVLENARPELERLMQLRERESSNVLSQSSASDDWELDSDTDDDDEDDDDYMETSQRIQPSSNERYKVRAIGKLPLQFAAACAFQRPAQAKSPPKRKPAATTTPKRSPSPSYASPSTSTSPPVAASGKKQTYNSAQQPHNVNATKSPSNSATPTSKPNNVNSKMKAANITATGTTRASSTTPPPKRNATTPPISHATATKQDQPKTNEKTSSVTAQPVRRNSNNKLKTTSGHKTGSRSVFGSSSPQLGQQGVKSKPTRSTPMQPLNKPPASTGADGSATTPPANSSPPQYSADTHLRLQQDEEEHAATEISRLWRGYKSRNELTDNRIELEVERAKRMLESEKVARTNRVNAEVRGLNSKLTKSGGYTETAIFRPSTDYLVQGGAFVDPSLNQTYPTPDSRTAQSAPHSHHGASSHNAYPAQQLPPLKRVTKFNSPGNAAAHQKHGKHSTADYGHGHTG